jgi:hypothetical protein
VPAIEVAARIVVALLVARKYDLVEAMTRGQRLSAEALRFAVEEYGRVLTDVPEAAWSMDIAPMDEVGAFHVIVDLWTEEEGRSDLSLELAARDRYNGAYEVEVLDLHVL